MYTTTYELWQKLSELSSLTGSRATCPPWLVDVNIHISRGANTLLDKYVGIIIWLSVVLRYPARVPWRILLLAMTDQQLWNILDRPGNPCYTRHVDLSTRKLYTFQLCMYVWSTDDSINNRAVTNQSDRSYVYNADAVISSPRPADHTIGEQRTILSVNSFSIGHFCQWSWSVMP